jgi:ATP-binding cassette subfamily F protein 3
MALLSLQDARFDYGREKILRGVGVSLNTGVKYALVGANGAGKTTLLAAMAGDLQLQGGTRQTAGSVTIRLLRQETTIDPGANPAGLLLDTVAGAAFTRERELEGRLAWLAAELAVADSSTQEDLVQQQGKLQDEFERLDGYSMQARLETALRGVGLMPESWQRPVSSLSGGERRRAALATVLLRGADLLLLDEPTNHLDLESCEWLEGFLESFPGAVVMVSHDRHFLDRIAQKTLHLDRGRLIGYSGNYSFFDEQSRLRYQQELSAWQRQQTKIRQTEEYIRRNIEGQKTRQAQSRRKQLEKEEKLEKPTAEPGLFRFRLEPVRPSGGTVLEAEGLTKGWADRTLLKDLDLHVSRGDRIGIIGPNGCGKSTLLKMLAGRIVPDTGRVVTGHNVDLGFYDQELSGVSDHNSVLGEMMSVDPVSTLGEHRSFLGAFGFGEDLFDRQVGRLSGGERGRLSLLRLIKEGHNTLLLDEPTNHLDIRSRESLEAALAEFPGTMVVVSHDRRFLDKIVHRLIVFTREGSVRLFPGNYADYVWKRRQELQEEKSPEPSETEDGGQKKETRPTETRTGGSASLSKNEINRRRQWMADAEARILELESTKEAALGEMASPDLGNDRRLELAHQCSQIDTELEAAMADWEKWGLEIEQGTAGQGSEPDPKHDPE